MMDREPTKEQSARVIRLENREWFDEHVRELQKEYGGKIVAIHGKKLVEVGNTPEDIKRLVSGKYPIEETFFIKVPIEPVTVIPYPE